MKQIERKQKGENLSDKDIDSGKFFELATSNKVYGNVLCLHEIKNEVLLKYFGVFDLNGLIVKGTVERKTIIRFRNLDDFEIYINAMDFDYDNEDVIFTGYVDKSNTLQFKSVKRSAYAKGTNYMKDMVEYK